MTETHSLVGSYLDRLDRALRDVPSARRGEIVGEIREHIDQAAGGSAEQATEAEIRTILDQLGDPETIAEDARDRLDVPQHKAGPLEGFALVLLLVGGFIGPGFGWIAGVVMLWISKVWTTRDKIVGTMFVPGGLALPFFLAAFAIGATTELAEACEVRPGPRGGGRGRITELCTSSTVSSDLLGQILIAAAVILPIAAAIYLGRRAFGRRAA